MTSGKGPKVTQVSLLKSSNHSQVVTLPVVSEFTALNSIDSIMIHAKSPRPWSVFDSEPFKSFINTELMHAMIQNFIDSMFMIYSIIH